jgi:hypothetical protein
MRLGNVNPDMIADVELLYRQHLTEADRRLVSDLTRHGFSDDSLDTNDISAVLGHPALEAAIFEDPVGEGPLVAASPFLTFAVAVHGTGAYLERATFVHEWVGPRQRIPVFNVAQLSDLAAEPVRRFFLIELLASYTHVASGVTWERTRRGWRRRRFSELDPLRLASLLEVVSPAEQAGVYRRLGDLALFLTGVFPDHTDVTGLAGIHAARLLRATGVVPDPATELGGVALLEYLGGRWYRRAAASVKGTPLGSFTAAGDMGERFSDARRFLNVVTDRYLFPLRDRWFGRR